MPPRPYLLLLPLILCNSSQVTCAAEPQVINYTGRIIGGSQPFTGEGRFKFALVDSAGQRVWTSGDNETPIEGGVPSGSVPLAVSRGEYQVRLGDSAAGMKPLGITVSANWTALQLQTWFNDGSGDWSEAGFAPLAVQTTALRTATTATVPPINGKPDDDIHQTILAELGRLRAEVGALRGELRAGTPPSEPKPPPAAIPPPVRVSLAEVERFALGDTKAPVVLVEFTDFECGYCKRFFEQAFPQLKAKFIDTGKLRLVSRNYPVNRHPQAKAAAMALLSAAAQQPEQYWAMRTWLFKDNRELSEDAYAKYAKEAGLDVPRFLADFAAKRHAPEIDRDIAAAAAIGITGTPSFVVGTSDGSKIDGELVSGAKSFEVFDRMIEMLLAAQTTGASPAVAGPQGKTETTK